MSKVFGNSKSSSLSLSSWAFKSENGLILTGGTACILLGIILGVSIPPDVTYAEPYRTLSTTIGWSYFVMWSVSFWPQVIINYLRKSVVGLSFDYVALNLLGFSCYSAYNCAYYWSPSVREQYKAQYGSYPAVQSNDVFFGLHAVIATLVTLGQMAIYERGEQKVTKYGIFLLTGISLSAIIAGILAGIGKISIITLLLTLSYLKLTISLTKYAPQAVLNWQRKSTEGWSIHNVLLDFAGGSLSVAQLVMDCTVTSDWSGVQGDPVKFGLGFTSMVFDVVFMIQHYILYPQKIEDDDTDSESEGVAFLGA